MCVSRLLKHTVDPHPSIRFPVLKPCDPVHGFSRPDMPGYFTGKGNGFLERAQNVGAEQ
jgi:hypothetical protein